MDIFSLIGAGSTLSLVGLCVTLAKQNGGKLKEYVRRDVCHEAMGRLEDRIKEIKEDTQEIKTILKNAK